MELYQELAKYQINKRELKKLYWKWKILKEKEAKCKIVNSFLPLALKIATEIFEKHPYFELMELFNESYLIIDKALDYYNPRRAELSTFIYLMLKWNLKHFIFRQDTPVRYTIKMKQKMKENGVPLNAVYLSEVDNELFIYELTPEEILCQKEAEEKINRFIKKYFSDEELKKIANKKSLPRSIIKKLKAISQEDLDEIFRI